MGGAGGGNGGDGGDVLPESKARPSLGLGWTLKSKHLSNNQYGKCYGTALLFWCVPEGAGS